MRACTSPQSHLVSMVVTLRERSHHGGINKQPRAHIQQWGGWCVVNHGVDCMDDVGVCGRPLWLNGGDGRDNVVGYH